ncbi:hypothetical protein J7M23_05255 [Candidatus Sumerlaeota bacterium]|nr:hypothetical protein [Candidatus Sumerlaeota bacterium]
MTHAYTPGLKVSQRTRIEKERILPLKGQVLVEKGALVKAEDVVARTLLPGNIKPVNVAHLLGVEPQEVPRYMLVKEGDEVKESQLIAQSKGFLGLFKSEVKAPVTGTVESISNITGQVMLREPPHPVEIKAYITGYVSEVIPDEGVRIVSVGSFIQGILGVGGERFGTIKVLVAEPEKMAEISQLNEEHRGTIIVAGKKIDHAFYQRCQELEINGVVVGSVDDMDLKRLLGYELGVAITGKEEVNTTLIITEGFGDLPIAERTFELLKACEGRFASINGATQIRAGVMRPEIIVADIEFLEKHSLAEIEQWRFEETSEVDQGLLEIGTRVRIIREPHFGRIGEVVDLPPELQEIETGAKVRVLTVKLSDGTRFTLPRANVELIEE